jgi:hypothetical protein
MVNRDESGLKKNGFAKVARIGGNSSADSAQELGIGYKSFVLLGVADLVAEIVQIAQMFVVAGMRHFYLIHRISP